MPKDCVNALIGDYLDYYHEAKAVLETLQDAIQEERFLSSLSGYSFTFEEKYRIKTTGSLRYKLDTKCKELVGSSPSPLALNDCVEDIVGARLIFLTKEHLFTFLEQMHDFEGFTIVKKEASSPFASDAKRYKELGCDIIERPHGYAGVHLILQSNLDHKVIKKAEIQLRTHFQESWSSFEHPLYKVQHQIPDHLMALKPLLANQMEALSQSFEYFFQESSQYINTQRQETVESFYHDLRQKDIDDLKEVSDYIGTFVTMKSDPKVYYVTSRGELIWVIEAWQLLPSLYGEQWINRVYPVEEEVFHQFDFRSESIQTEDQLMELLNNHV